QKLPFRLFGTLSDALTASRPVDRLCIPVAGWMHFIRRKAAAGEPVTDPLATRLLEIGRACQNHAPNDVPAFLRLDSVFPRALVAETRFVSALSRAYEKIATGVIGMPS